MRIILRQFFILLISVQLVKAQVPAYVELQQAQRDWQENNRSFRERNTPFQNPNHFKSSEEVERFLESTSEGRYGYIVDQQTNVVSVYENSDPEKKIINNFQLTAKKELKTFSPKNFKNRLIEQAQQIKEAGAKGVKHTVVNLPMESAIFYMAMGSVAAFYMFNNFGHNPAGLKLFNDQQLSSVGITSLFMFLATQNAVSNIAMLALKNPKWHILLPYLGMIAGATVQNYTTSLMTDPNIKACIKEWFGDVTAVQGAYEDPCEKAYEYFTIQKPWEFAPGLTSMILSTAMATTGQWGLSKAALVAEKKITEKVITNQARRQVAKTILLRFAGFMNPASVPFLAVTGVWLYLTKYSNLALFATLDHMIVYRTTEAVKNLQESYILPFVKSIKKTTFELDRLVKIQEQTAWNYKANDADCKENKHADCSGLYENLNRYNDQMKTWRMANMTEVMETHSSWQTYLGTLVLKYNASKEFYGRVIEQVRILLGFGKPTDEKKLNRLYPFFGVKTTKTQDLDETHYTDPNLPESEQLTFVQLFQLGMQAILEKYDQKKYYTPELEAGLFAELKKYFVNNPGDTWDDKVRLGYGLKAVERYLTTKENRTDVRGNLYLDIKKLYTSIGHPSVKLYPGEGLIAALTKSPTLLALTKDIPVPNSSTLIRYQNAQDEFLIMMLCGPDIEKRESVISSTWGYPSRFTPPRVTDIGLDKSKFNFFCDGMGMGENKLLYDSSFVAPFKHNPQHKRVTYQGPFEYIKYNIKDNVVGTREKPAFDDWWTQNTEKQMTDAFSGFQDLYKGNIAKLMERLHQEKPSIWNRSGFLENGLMKSVQQEVNTYLLLLAKILQDTYKAQHKSEVPKEALKFQQDVLVEFVRMQNLMKQITAHEINGKIVITGDLENYDLEKSAEKIDKMGTEIAMLFGVEEKEEKQPGAAAFDFSMNKKSETTPAVPETKALVELSDGTRAIVVKTLEHIQSAAYETMSYGMIINAVSWKNLQNIKRASETKEEQSQKVKDKVNQLLNQQQPGLKFGR